tara:strand:+ start:303 stop:545 length:243 start_codon:yes stop_codon:yes gene_type:complete
MTNQFKRNSKLSILYTILRNEEKTVSELMAILGITQNSLRYFISELRNMNINVEMNHVVVGKVTEQQYPKCLKLMSFKIV